VETGIAPALLIDEGETMLRTMIAYIKKRNERMGRRR
jgi:hypothetical protein